MQQISSGWFATLRSPAVRVRWGLAPNSAGDSAAAAPVEVPHPVAAVARLRDGDAWGFVSDFRDNGDDWGIWHRFLGSRHFTSMFIWTCATWRCSILQHRYLPARVRMKWKLARCCPCTLFVAISDSWRHVLAFLSWKPRLLDVHSVTDVYPHTIGQYVALAHITEVYGKYDWLKLLASLMTFSLKSGRTLCCSIGVVECDMCDREICTM